MKKITFKQFIQRCKNPKILTAIVSGCLLVLVNVGVIDTHLSDNIMKGVNVILSLGVGLGVFSNPDSNIKE
jgi:uncharacterized membrane protein